MERNMKRAEKAGPGEQFDWGNMHGRLMAAAATGHLKTGVPCRGERLEKFNQLLRIEKELGVSAMYAGRKPF